MSLTSLFTQQVAVERWGTRAGGDDYVVRPDWGGVTTDVPCSIQDRGAALSETVAGRNVRFNAVGYFAPGVDLKPGVGDNAHGDRLTVTRGAGLGAVYQVRAVLDQTGRGALVKALLERE